MTGQTKDGANYKKADCDRDGINQSQKEPPNGNVGTDDKTSSDKVDPSTREILHMLQMMEAKSSA